MFYVYVYKDPRPTKNLQTVYVGKGTGERMYAHWRAKVHKNKGFGSFLALLRREQREPVIEQVATFEDEAAAFVEEMRLIALYGRRDQKSGSLFNLTDGGEGFVGAIRTEEWINNIREAMLQPEVSQSNAVAATARWQDSEYRAKVTAAIRVALADPDVHARREAAKALFTQTPEFRNTMRAVANAQWQNPEYVGRVVEGQKRVQGSPEARAKKSANSAAGWANAEVREKRQTGIKNARSSEESKAKTKAQAKAQWADPEYAAKQIAYNREIAARPEVKAAKASAAKALWADPEWKAKMLEARRAKKAAKQPDMT